MLGMGPDRTAQCRPPERDAERDARPDHGDLLPRFLGDRHGARAEPVMGFITDVVIGDESKIRYAMALCAGLMTPLAALSAWFGLRTYDGEIRDIKTRERMAMIGESA